MASGALRRLMAEYKQLLMNPPEGVIAGPMSEDNFFEWESCITGPGTNKLCNECMVCKLLLKTRKSVETVTTIHFLTVAKINASYTVVSNSDIGSPGFLPFSANTHSFYQPLAAWS